VKASGEASVSLRALALSVKDLPAAMSSLMPFASLLASSDSRRLNWDFF